MNIRDLWFCSCRWGLKPWQSDWTFALNMDWTNVQCKMLRRFATLSSPVQSCAAMLRVVQSILKEVKNVQDKNKFLLFEENVQSFCHPTEHCPVCASALQMKQRRECIIFWRHFVSQIQIIKLTEKTWNQH